MANHPLECHLLGPIRLGHHPGKMIKLLIDHLDHLDHPRETKDLFSPTPFRWVAKRQKAPKNIKS
jgi:hypothetical protein